MITQDNEPVRALEQLRRHLAGLDGRKGRGPLPGMPGSFVSGIIRYDAAKDNLQIEVPSGARVRVECVQVIL